VKDSYHLKEEAPPGTIVAMAFLTRDVVSGEADLWWLNRIQVNRDRRGEGLGTKLLEEILADADHDGATLLVGVEPDTRGMFRKLANWYTRHGFKPTKGRLTQYFNVMVRRPGNAGDSQDKRSRS
jgi:GNAT superfamily N-acetyltransferase